MEKTLIAYHLDAYEEGLVFQITEQSDDVTNYVKRVGNYNAKNGWRVTIDKEPEIDVKNRAIFLQGKKQHKDHNMFRVQNMGSNKEVKKVISQIESALQDLGSDVKNSKNQRRPFRFYDQIIIDTREIDSFRALSNCGPNIIVIK